MRRLVLAAAVLLAAAGARADSRRDGVFEAVRSFRPAQQAFLGSAEFLRMGTDAAIDQLEAAAKSTPTVAGVPPAPIEPEADEFDFESEAVHTFYRTVWAYNNHVRSKFTKEVGDDYLVDKFILDEAIQRDFTTFSFINLNAVVDNVEIAGPNAIIFFHYNLIRTTRAGVTTRFDGRTRVRMRKEGEGKEGKPAVFLVGQDPPVLFGTTLGSAENPQWGPQGPTADKASTGPLTPASASCPTPHQGIVEIEDANFGFSFQSESVVGGAGNPDFFRPGAPMILRAVNGARIASLGICQLNSIHTVPTGVNGVIVPFALGECFVLKRTSNHFAILRPVSVGINGGGLPETTYQWRSQAYSGAPAGTTCF